MSFHPIVRATLVAAALALSGACATPANAQQAQAEMTQQLYLFQYAPGPACRALGIPSWSMIWRVVIPQVVRIAAGPWVTLAVGALKGLSLASAVGVSEIVFVARQGIIITGEPFQFIAMAAILYGVISAAMMAAAIILERRADYLLPR